MPVTQLYQVLRQVSLVHLADGLDLAENHDVHNCNFGPSNVPTFHQIHVHLRQDQVKELAQVLLDSLVIRSALLAENFRVGHGLYEFACDSPNRSHEVCHDFVNLPRLPIVEKM